MGIQLFDLILNAKCHHLLCYSEILHKSNGQMGNK